MLTLRGRWSANDQKKRHDDLAPSLGKVAAFEILQSARYGSPAASVYVYVCGSYELFSIGS